MPPGSSPPLSSLACGRATLISPRKKKDSPHVSSISASQGVRKRKCPPRMHVAATQGHWWLFFLYDQDQALASAADPRDAKSSSHLFDDCSRPHARSHVRSPGHDWANGKPTLRHGAASWSWHGKNPPLCLSSFTDWPLTRPLLHCGKARAPTLLTAVCDCVV